MTNSDNNESGLTNPLEGRKVTLDAKQADSMTPHPEELSDDSMKGVEAAATTATTTTAPALESSSQPFSPAHLICGCTPFNLWRYGFYILMAYNWGKSFLGPCDGPWEDSLTYDHAEWVHHFAPKTQEAVEKFRWFGIVAALLSTFNDTATIIFAVLSGQLVFTSLVMFINHYYLFFLLSTIMAIYCHSGKDNFHEKAGWLHVLRGQIVVVYAFASVWKFDTDWLNGVIVKGIFLSFEEQGVNRGIPWSKIYDDFPYVFVFLGVSGLLLDFMLFSVLMFLPPGHKLQAIAFVFHGFTGYTMSQRIGYSFPIAMIMAGLLFQRSEDIDKDQASIGGDSLSHAQWLLFQLRPNRKPSESKEIEGLKKRHMLPMLFLFVQWIIPLRMPLISGGSFKFTGEGYRWSWTMMLHSKSSLHSAGISFMTLRPRCGGSLFPNPLANKFSSMDIHSYPYEIQLVNNPRSASVLQMFPRQMPKLAQSAKKQIGSQCTHDITMTTSYFSSTNEGPFHRIIDPTSDLLEIHRNHASLAWLYKLWYAAIDKAPPGNEFVLKGIGSMNLPSDLKNTRDEITIVDRSPCLQTDPVRIHISSFNIEFDSNSELPFRLLLRGCPELDTKNCKEIHVEKGEVVHVPAIRTVTIGIDRRRNLGSTCSESTKEDLVIKLTQIEKH